MTAATNERLKPALNANNDQAPKRKYTRRPRGTVGAQPAKKDAEKFMGMIKGLIDLYYNG